MGGTWIGQDAWKCTRGAVEIREVAQGEVQVGKGVWGHARGASGKMNAGPWHRSIECMRIV